jgi:hypothetical protein
MEITKATPSTHQHGNLRVWGGGVRCTRIMFYPVEEHMT